MNASILVEFPSLAAHVTAALRPGPVMGYEPRHVDRRVSKGLSSYWLEFVKIDFSNRYFNVRQADAPP